jgi:hypothetical protein
MLATSILPVCTVDLPAGNRTIASVQGTETSGQVYRAVCVRLEWIVGLGSICEVPFAKETRNVQEAFSELVAKRILSRTMGLADLAMRQG